MTKKKVQYIGKGNLMISLIIIGALIITIPSAYFSWSSIFNDNKYHFECTHYITENCASFDDDLASNKEKAIDYILFIVMVLTTLYSIIAPLFSLIVLFDKPFS